MRKRVLTLFLVFSLLICPFYVYGENFDSAENTVSGEDLKNSESMHLLSALGILSFTENAPSFVTRQQFVEYVANMVKIKSGDILEVATVVKSLMLRDKEKGLSTGERKMLSNAKQILISEIVVATGNSHEVIENRLIEMVDEELAN